MYVQQLIQNNNKENSKALLLAHFEENPTEGKNAFVFHIKICIFWVNVMVQGYCPGGMGSEPLPYFKESRTPKTYLILGKSHNRTRSSPDSQNIPYFRENLIIPGTWSGPDSEIIPYYREIWWNHTLF